MVLINHIDMVLVKKQAMRSIVKRRKNAALFKYIDVNSPKIEEYL